MAINRTMSDEQIQNLTYDDLIHIIYNTHLRNEFTQKEQEGLVLQLMRIMFRVSNKHNIDLKKTEELINVYENDIF